MNGDHGCIFCNQVQFLTGRESILLKHCIIKAHPGDPAVGDGGAVLDGPFFQGFDQAGDVIAIAIRIGKQVCRDSLPSHSEEMRVAIYETGHQGLAL